MAKQEAMAIRALTKKYGTFTALDSATLSVARGEILGLVGKNGAGKTTLLKCITGQTLPTSGELRLFGQSTPQGLREARRRIGSIVETPGFYRDMSARQNLEYYRIQRGLPDKAIVEEALHDVGLHNTGRKPFKSFSLGMKQRLGLALALMNHPDLLVLDEPINGLDPVGIIEIRELLLALNREKKMTLLIASHVLAELQNLATSYTFIDGGAIVQTMTAEQLNEHSGGFIRLVVEGEARAAILLEQHFPGIQFRIQPDRSIHIYALDGSVDEVNRLLVQHRVPLMSIESRSMNLEAYFVSLVGRERRV